MEIIDINKIRPSSRNPRKIDKKGLEKMMKSIQEFPEMLNLRSIVIDEGMEIIGGNQRFLACKKLGYKEVPVIRAEGLTEEQKKEFLIKDNVYFGEFNFEDFDVDVGLLNDWGVDIDIEHGEAAEDTPGYESAEGNFSDDGITAKEQYAVTVMCVDEQEQIKIYKVLHDMGLECKVVVV